MTNQVLRVEKNFCSGYFSTAGMAPFNDNLRRLQAERRIPNKRLAEVTGATPSMVSKWRKNVIPEGRRIVQIARCLRVSVDELEGTIPVDQGSHTRTAVHTESDAEPVDRDITIGYVKDDVPVVGEAEASSNGLIIWGDEGIVRSQVERWVSRSYADGDPKAYGLVVRNDSMALKYLPGTVVIAQPRLEVRDGHFAVVYLNSGERLVKRVFRTAKGWLLKSVNPEYPDREVPSDDVKMLHRIRHSIEP